MRRTVTQRPRGQSLVEFALVLPLLLLLLMGVFDFGRAIYAYNAVSNAAKEGARKAIVDQTVVTIQTEAAQQAVALGIDPNTVQVAFRPVGASTGTCSPIELGCNAEVAVTYQWRAITPIIGGILGPISVGSVARLPIERVYP
jgi:Flp pilus assembly protein TadG